MTDENKTTEATTATDKSELDETKLNSIIHNHVVRAVKSQNETLLKSFEEKLASFAPKEPAEETKKKVSAKDLELEELRKSVDSLKADKQSAVESARREKLMNDLRTVSKGKVLDGRYGELALKEFSQAVKFDDENAPFVELQKGNPLTLAQGFKAWIESDENKDFRVAPSVPTTKKAPEIYSPVAPKQGANDMENILGAFSEKNLQS